MKYIIELLGSLFLGLGVVFLAMPIFLYWFIYGSYERYIWIINGPYPFSHFGGGPFQLVMYVGFIFLGIVCIVAALIMRRWLKGQ